MLGAGRPGQPHTPATPTWPRSMSSATSPRPSGAATPGTTPAHPADRWPFQHRGNQPMTPTGSASHPPREEPPRLLGAPGKPVPVPQRTWPATAMVGLRRGSRRDRAIVVGYPAPPGRSCPEVGSWQGPTGSPQPPASSAPTTVRYIRIRRCRTRPEAKRGNPCRAVAPACKILHAGRGADTSAWWLEAGGDVLLAMTAAPAQDVPGMFTAPPVDDLGRHLEFRGLVLAAVPDERPEVIHDLGGGVVPPTWAELASDS